LFAYANAICDWLTVGDRNRRVASPFGAALSVTAIGAASTTQGIDNTNKRTARPFGITHPPRARS
jgi:hypothetical protein